MAFTDWISRLHGRITGITKSVDTAGTRVNSPKSTEKPIVSAPEAPLSESPSDELVSPTDTEQSIALDKRPQEFGRLKSWRGSLILLVTSGSQFLDNVFMTSSNTALASIQEEFKVSNTDLQWMISAYTLSFGGLLLLAGSLSDRYGNKLDL